MPAKKVVYPDSDGQPMAENTLQFRWIVTIQGGVDALLKDDPKVFVAGDLLWYPVEGNNVLRQAPDVMVAFGRPKGDRGSYRQWEEDGIAPQVVFEVLSPGNRSGEMSRKFVFYEDYGVEEYYIYDPDRVTLEGHIRTNGKLEELDEMDGHVSPRLGIRFDMSGDELVIYRPDGNRFLTYVELMQQAAEEKQRADEERLARLQAQERAGKAEDRAGKAEDRAGKAEDRANKAEERAARLAAKLRELGIEPNGA